MNAPNLFDEISASGEDAIRAAHRWAVAAGVDVTRLDGERERAHTAHTLMCLSIEPVLTVAVSCECFQAQAAIVGDPASPLLHPGLRRLRTSSAGATRLMSRALEVHARDTGYLPDAWAERAHEAAATVLDGGDGGLEPPRRPGAADVARAAVSAVSAALLASEHDRMAVPGELAAAIGCTTALFMLATELLGRADGA